MLGSQAHGQLSLQLVSVLPVLGSNRDEVAISVLLEGLLLGHGPELLSKLEGLGEGLWQDKVDCHLHTAAQVAHLQGEYLNDILWQSPCTTVKSSTLEWVNPSNGANKMIHVGINIACK